MSTPETGHNREQLKADLDALGQRITRAEAGENLGSIDLNQLHEQYDRLQAELDGKQLDQAA